MKVLYGFNLLSGLTISCASDNIFVCMCLRCSCLNPREDHHMETAGVELLSEFVVVQWGLLSSTLFSGPLYRSLLIKPNYFRAQKTTSFYRCRCKLLPKHTLGFHIFIASRGWHKAAVSAGFRKGLLLGINTDLALPG